MESSRQNPENAQLIQKMREYEPKLLACFTPTNAIEQKTAFLSGDIDNPVHDYSELDGMDCEDNLFQIDVLGRQILADPEFNPKFFGAHKDFIDDYRKKTLLAQQAHAFNHAEDAESKARAKESFMDLNRELYGQPDETTYRSLLNEKMAKIADKDFSGSTAVLRDELINIVDYTPGEPTPERFKPSNVTVAWMHNVTETLYAGPLSHVPDHPTFDSEEIAKIFRIILKVEFGEAAADWTVDLEEGLSINVRASEKRIVIPPTRNGVKNETVKGLVVHEIGVHMLRAIQGEITNLPMLSTGLANYYNAEEGLGMVMEQAHKGAFTESGVAPYITAGAAHHDGKDFRGIFELKWRLALLDKADKDIAFIQDDTTKAKDMAYKSVMRSMRGTDELPWFKDLAYYNGAASQWKHLENIRGDDIKFMFMLLGKADPSDIQHERVLYETRTQ